MNHRLKAGHEANLFARYISRFKSTLIKNSNLQHVNLSVLYHSGI